MCVLTGFEKSHSPPKTVSMFVLIPCLVLDSRPYAKSSITRCPDLTAWRRRCISSLGPVPKPVVTAMHFVQLALVPSSTFGPCRASHIPRGRDMYLDKAFHQYHPVVSRCLRRVGNVRKVRSLFALCHLADLGPPRGTVACNYMAVQERGRDEVAYLFKWH